MDHSVLAPSDSGKWGKCSGSVAMQQSFPELTIDENEAALQGTAAHWVAEQLIKGYTDPNESIITNIDQLPDLAPNGEVIDDYMFDSAKEYCDEIMAVCNKVGGLRNLRIEERVDIPRIHKLCYGHVDAHLFHETEGDKNNHLYIWDFKYGFMPVEPEVSDQLLLYAIGVMQKLDIVDDTKLTLHLTIVQPRVYHRFGSVRTYTVVASDLRSRVNDLHFQANQALSDKAELVTGNQCIHCSGRRGCPANQKATQHAIEVTDQPTPQRLDGHSLSLELLYLERAHETIKSRLNALTSEALTRLQAGENVGSHAIGHNKPRKAWKEGSGNQVIAVGKLLGHDLAKPAEPIAVGKALNSGIDQKVINQYIDEKSGSTKLILKDELTVTRTFNNKGK